jgi:hypothetical protein
MLVRSDLPWAGDALDLFYIVFPYFCTSNRELYAASCIAQLADVVS